MTSYTRRKEALLASQRRRFCWQGKQRPRFHFLLTAHSILRLEDTSTAHALCTPSFLVSYLPSYQLSSRISRWELPSGCKFFRSKLFVAPECPAPRSIQSSDPVTIPKDHSLRPGSSESSLPLQSIARATGNGSRQVYNVLLPQVVVLIAPGCEHCQGQSHPRATYGIPNSVRLRSFDKSRLPSRVVRQSYRSGL
jgi:hypothetical protein